MLTVSYRFQEVKLHATKSWKNADGKRIVRRRTFSQTLNPYNKDANGVVKDAAAIRKELQKEIADWKAAPE